jgi:hypothetical protein
MALPEQAARWREQLMSFCERFRRGDNVSDPRDEASGDGLSPIEDEQRRVTGGVLLQFLDFMQGDAAFDNFPELEDNSIGERVFVFATDRPGAAAAHDLIEIDGEHVMVVTKAEWRAWLEAGATDSDEAYDKHFLFWSVWHQRTEVDREIVEALDDVDGEPWIHEEGFAVADRAGRGARHLWSWQSGELELVDEALTTWVSQPGAMRGPDPKDEFPDE